MGIYLPEPDTGNAERIGVLLVNLGTPDAPTKAALKRYLGEFLSDPRVVELPRWLWKPLLHGIILNTRPAKSAAKYATIWSKDGSPLFVHTQKQAKLLRGWLGEALTPSPASGGGLGRGKLGINESTEKPPLPCPPPLAGEGDAAALRALPIEVEFAMRYGNPSVADGIGKLKAAGCKRILVVPLYPQYSGPTTGSVLDALAHAIPCLRDVPEIRTVRHFPTHPGYIAALAAAVQSHWMAQASRPDLLLMSFHGMPRQAIEQGDPYLDDCRATAQALAQALGLSESQYKLTFQSRFGRGEWLKPYTAETLAELPRQGVKTLDVLCPGFAADCLETLEEIALEGKAAFLSAGGQEYRYIPALNERPEWLEALRDIVLTNLAGWV